MAFIKKIWKDRISQFPNRRTINDGNVTKQVTVGRDEGAITEEGDAFNSENMNDLEQRIEDAYGDVAALVADEVANQYDSSNVIFDDEPDENHGTGYTVTSKGIKEAIDSGLVHTKTVSGSLVHITDGADNIPVKSLASEIVAVESGNGQPKSPTNPYTISGFASGVVGVYGKNLYNKATITTGKYITNTGSEISTASGSYSDYIPIKKNTPYYFSHIVGLGSFYSVAVYDENKTFIECVNIQGSSDASGTITFTRGAYIRVNASISYVDICQIEFGTTATTYEAYNGNTYTFAFGQTVYGGHFDNKGNLVVTHGIVDLGSATWQYNSSYSVFYTKDIKGINYGAPFICEIYEDAGPVSISLLGNYSGELRTDAFYVKNTDYGSDTNAFKTAMNGIMLVRELANPTTLAITSQDIPTLLGENNIFSNTGDLEVEYYVDTDAIYAIRDVIDEFAMQSDWDEADNTKADYIKNKPTIPANADFSLSGLSDTDITSPSAGQVLAFDGDNWVNSNISKSGEVVYSNYVTGAYISGSGNYVEFCIPINTKATSGTITNLGTTLNVFIGSTRLTNEITLSGSSVVAIKDGYAQIELKLNSTQTANSVATISLDGFTVNFA